MAKKLGPQALRVQAAPVVPTLVAPRFEGLDRLAQSLTTFAGGIQQLGVERAQKQAAEAEEAGRREAALAIAQGKDTFAELEEAGILSKGSNPFFRDGVLEMAGRARADQFGASMQVAYAERFADDPSFDEDDFNDFAEEFATQFEEDHPGMVDPAVTDGFATRAADYLNSQRQKHAGIVADNILELGDETLGTLFRGKILDRLANGDPLTFVADAIVALDEVRAQWLENLGGVDRASRIDKRKMNDKLVAVITSAVTTGDLTDTQATEMLGKMLSGKGSPLINVPRHAEALTVAAGRRASFVLQQDSLEETTRVRAQQRLEDEGRTELWALFDPKTGDLDLGPLMAKVAANPSAYDENYIGDLNRLRNNILSAANAPYVSNQDLKDQIHTNILQRRYTNVSEMRNFIGNSVTRVGGLNPTDASALIKELDRMTTMDSAGGNTLRLFNAGMERVKAGVGAFSPDPIIQASFNKAAVDFSELFQGFIAENPGITLSDPKYQAFLSQTTEDLRNTYLDPVQRGIIDGQLRQVEVADATAHFQTRTFITDVDTLTRWLAETDLELNDENSGSFLSEDINLFFLQPDRALAEEDMTADILRAGVIAQLQRNGVNPNDGKFQKRLDRIKAQILRDNRTRGNTGSLSTALSGLSARTDAALLDSIRQAEIARKAQEQLDRNRAAVLPAPPAQNPNIPVTPTSGSDDES